MAQDQITKYRVVAIGGSAGSLDIILKIISSPKLPATVAYIIIIHRKNDPSSILSDLISARSSMPVREVEDKQSISAGTIYIAPSDYHLLVEDENNFSLDSSEKIHHSRPSIDVTFESLAAAFGPAVIGVLLSGANADGAEGLKKIRIAGGFTIVQDPKSAEVGYMPMQAIQLYAPSLITDGDEMAEQIIKILSI